MKRKLVLGLIASVLAVTAVAFGAPKIGHAANTCSGSSPLLGAGAAYMTFDGKSDGVLVQVAAWGVLSAADPASDCLWVDTHFTAEKSTKFYADFDAAVAGSPEYYSTNRGVSWNLWYDNENVYSPSQLPTTVLDSHGIELNGTPPSGFCFSINDVDSYFADASGHNYTISSGIPNVWTGTLCPK